MFQLLDLVILDIHSLRYAPSLLAATVFLFYGNEADDDVIARFDCLERATGTLQKMMIMQLFPFPPCNSSFSLLLS